MFLLLNNKNMVYFIQQRKEHLRLINQKIGSVKMGIFDKYSRKTKEEKKRFKDSYYYLTKEIPDFYFSKKILKIFPDINQRDDIYFYLNKINITPEMYKKLLYLAESNKQMVMQLVNNNIVLTVVKIML